MQRLVTLALLAVISSGLFACGKRGPLSLPPTDASFSESSDYGSF